MMQKTKRLFAEGSFPTLQSNGFARHRKTEGFAMRLFLRKQKRLFVAVNLPEEVKKDLAAFLKSFPKEKWKTVKQENMHITLCFLGWIAREQENKIMHALLEMLEQEAMEEFEMEVNGFGHFEGRVVWLGIGRGAEELKILSKKVCEAIGARNEEFHAHITLARNKGATRQEARQIVEQLRKTNYKKTVRIKSFELMESFLHREGPEYKKVFSLTLLETNPQ